MNAIAPSGLACAVEPIASGRNIMLDVLQEGRKKDKAWGWFEIDVSRPRKYMKEAKEKTGERHSFTAFVLWCVGKAVDEHKAVHAVLARRKLYVFDEVDISTLVEREDENHNKIVASMVVRRVNKRAYRDINEEIQNAQTCAFTGVSLGNSKEARLASLLARLPRFLRVLVWMQIRRDPYLRKRLMGTVNLSAVGMFLPRGGSAMTYTPWPCDVVVGGVTRKPWAVGENIEIRDVLDLAIAVDHSAVDGGPASRFVTRLCELLEKGEGLIP